MTKTQIKTRILTILNNLDFATQDFLDFVFAHSSICENLCELIEKWHETNNLNVLHASELDYSALNELQKLYKELYKKN